MQNKQNISTFPNRIVFVGAEASKVADVVQMAEKAEAKVGSPETVDETAMAKMAQDIENRLDDPAIDDGTKAEFKDMLEKGMASFEELSINAELQNIGELLSRWSSFNNDCKTFLQTHSDLAPQDGKTSSVSPLGDLARYLEHSKEETMKIMEEKIGLDSTAKILALTAIDTYATLCLMLTEPFRIGEGTAEAIKAAKDNNISIGSKLWGVLKGVGTDGLRALSVIPIFKAGSVAISKVASKIKIPDSMIKPLAENKGELDFNAIGRMFKRSKPKPSTAPKPTEASAPATAPKPVEAPAPTTPKPVEAPAPTMQQADVTLAKSEKYLKELQNGEKIHDPNGIIGQAQKNVENATTQLKSAKSKAIEASNASAPGQRYNPGMEEALDSAKRFEWGNFKEAKEALNKAEDTLRTVTERGKLAYGRHLSAVEDSVKAAKGYMKNGKPTEAMGNANRAMKQGKEMAPKMPKLTEARSSLPKDAKLHPSDRYNDYPLGSLARVGDKLDDVRITISRVEGFGDQCVLDVTDASGKAISNMPRWLKDITQKTFKRSDKIISELREQADLNPVLRGHNWADKAARNKIINSPTDNTAVFSPGTELLEGLSFEFKTLDGLSTLKRWNNAQNKQIPIELHNAIAKMADRVFDSAQDAMAILRRDLRREARLIE